MNGKETVQFKFQNSQYAFPYHYLPEFDGNKFHIAKAREIGYEYMAYVAYVISKLGNYSDVVDFGCGDGRVVHELKKAAPDAYVRGVDISTEAIAFAKAFNQDDACIAGDLCDDNIFSGYKFSFGTCIEVMEHIPPADLPGFVTGMSKHLKPGARLLITVPSDNVPTNKKHFQHFNEDKLRDVLSKEFEVDEILYINQTNWKVRRMRSLLMNKYFILNYQPWLNAVFRYYRNNLFFGEQKNTRRIFCSCRRK